MTERVSAYHHHSSFTDAMNKSEAHYDRDKLNLPDC